MRDNNQPNYVVVTRSFMGTVTTNCDTVEDVWTAIGNMSFGGLYEVTSPTEQPLYDFIPF